MLAKSEKIINQGNWEQERLRSIGASEAAAVLNKSPYQSRYALGMEKSGKIPPEKLTEEDEDRFWLAHEHERTLADWFTRKTGAIVTDVGGFTIQRHPHNDFMTATLDRVVTLPYSTQVKGIPEQYMGKTGIAEMKASNLRGMWADENEVPEHVWIQVQHQMAVTQYEFAVVIALVGAYDPKWFFVERDNEFISDLEITEGKFWHEIQSGIMQDADGSESTAAALKRLRMVNGDIRVAGPEAAQKHAERIALKAQIDELTAQKDALDNWFKSEIGTGKGIWFVDAVTGKRVQYTFTETVRESVITVDARMADVLAAAKIPFEMKEGSTSRRLNPPRQAKG